MAEGEQVVLHLLFEELTLIKLTNSITTTETNIASKNQLFTRFFDVNVLCQLRIETCPDYK